MTKASLIHLSAFLVTLNKYNGGLSLYSDSSKSAVTCFWRKVQWALYMKGEAHTMRTAIAADISDVNTLLHLSTCKGMAVQNDNTLLETVGILRDNTNAVTD